MFPSFQIKMNPQYMQPQSQYGRYAPMPGSFNQGFGPGGPPAQMGPGGMPPAQQAPTSGPPGYQRPPGPQSPPGFYGGMPPMPTGMPPGPTNAPSGYPGPPGPGNQGAPMRGPLPHPQQSGFGSPVPNGPAPGQGRNLFSFERINVLAYV